MNTKEFEGHTPGPWSAISPYTYGNSDWEINAISSVGKIVIARLVFDCDGSQESNAALMAAAPDILQERNKLLGHMKFLLEMINSNDIGIAKAYIKTAIAECEKGESQ